MTGCLPPAKMCRDQPSAQPSIPIGRVPTIMKHQVRAGWVGAQRRPGRRQRPGTDAGPDVATEVQQHGGLGAEPGDGPATH